MQRRDGDAVSWQGVGEKVPTKMRQQQLEQSLPMPPTNQHATRSLLSRSRVDWAIEAARRVSGPSQSVGRSVRIINFLKTSTS
jgi:hypothetical protein